uniref:protein MIZU-KUSSEI 1-like n=1 Tax=Erigeron canadensis TaxID=72917 RepID=UPI001CB9C50B|nr:protein MIZU-KUSSEI 1-like [Erigeron canadensis]
MAKTSQDKKAFHWSTKVSNQDEEKEEEPSSFNPCPQKINQETELPSPLARPKKLQTVTIAKFRSALLNALHKNRPSLLHGLGPRVVGTLFGSRKGHVHFAFQRNPAAQPAFLIELQTPISGLVNEMASGLVRIALECDKEVDMIKKVGSSRRILEEPVWRTYCNGKKCGFGMKKECGEKEWKVLKAVEPISMGAGVLPAEKQGDDDKEDGVANNGGEIMYMRAKFERVVGSRDSEAFYMMNPDSNGAPELSIYLLRV